MTRTELHYASITELGAWLRKREISPVELTRAAVERAETLNPKLNAFITIVGEQAEADARRAERELQEGQDRGPLHGIPFSLKDIYATKGVRTTSGAKVLFDHVPDEDATTAARLKTAGAVLFAKCNTSEFAAGPDTKNVHFGAAHNPWDTSRIPGGSSGGSGAAVAAGVGAFSLGSDTGGSIRIPSAACGTVGLKPTYGRVSKFGVTVLSWSLDTCGPLARSVTDAALVLEAIAGHDPRDPTTSRRPVEPFAEDLERGAKGLRIGVPRDGYFERTEPEVRALVRAAIEHLEHLGAEVREVSIDGEQYAFPAANLISWVESAVFHETWQDRWAQDYGPELQARLPIGRAVSGVDYLRAHQVRRAIRQRTRELYREIDLLATPTIPLPAPPIAVDSVKVAGQEEPVRSAMGRLCRLGSITGYPVVAVPCGFTSEGLPASLALMAAPFQERTALQAAYAYEQSTDWHRRRPQL